MPQHASADLSEIERIDRPGYRLYAAQVEELIPLSPSFVRVRLTCPDFAHFGQGRQDQRIKVIFPHKNGGIPDLGPLDPLDASDGGWFTRWRQMPDETRPAYRTYTVREVDRAGRLVDIDFVRHGDSGVSGHWLANLAAPGAEVLVAGPDGRSVHDRGGIDFTPGAARRILLAGDETAVPAIMAICERIPDGVSVRAFCEVPTGADVLDLTAPAGVQVTWLPREGATHGSELIAALGSFVRDNPEYLVHAPEGDTLSAADDGSDDEVLWDLAEETGGGFYAWLAGEAGVVRTLRRLLVNEHHVDRRAISFMGYWRIGRAEA